MPPNYQNQIDLLVNRVIALENSLKTLQENLHSLIDQGTLNSQAVVAIKKIIAEQEGQITKLEMEDGAGHAKIIASQVKTPPQDNSIASKWWWK